MTREHFVAGRAPDWSRRHHLFRHLDGSDADWRSLLTPDTRRQCVGDLAGWHDAYAFMLGSCTTVLGCLLLLELFGVTPW